jgi:hypothetical protein
MPQTQSVHLATLAFLNAAIVQAMLLFALPV